MDFEGRGKFKVGDVVTPISSELDYTMGKEYTIVRVETSDGPIFIDDAGKEWNTWGNHWKLVRSAHHIAPGDTVRLASGEPFTSGLHTATVDNVTADGIVLLTTGGWLAGELVEKVEFKVGDRFNYTRCTDDWQGLTVESVSVDSDGVMYFATCPKMGFGGFRAANMEHLPELPAEPAATTDHNTVTLTLELDTTSFQASLADQFQRIADALRAA